MEPLGKGNLDRVIQAIDTGQFYQYLTEMIPGTW